MKSRELVNNASKSIVNKENSIVKNIYEHCIEILKAHLLSSKYDSSNSRSKTISDSTGIIEYVNNSRINSYASNTGVVTSLLNYGLGLLKYLSTVVVVPKYKNKDLKTPLENPYSSPFPLKMNYKTIHKVVESKHPYRSSINSSNMKEIITQKFPVSIQSATTIKIVFDARCRLVNENDCIFIKNDVSGELLYTHKIFGLNDKTSANHWPGATELCPAIVIPTNSFILEFNFQSEGDNENSINSDNYWGFYVDVYGIIEEPSTELKRLHKSRMLTFTGNLNIVNCDEISTAIILFYLESNSGLISSSSLSITDTIALIKWIFESVSIDSLIETINKGNNTTELEEILDCVTIGVYSAYTFNIFAELVEFINANSGASSSGKYTF